MSNTVYGNIFSTRTQRVLVVLEELGLDYNLQVLDFAKADHQVSNFSIFSLYDKR